jgi:ribosomal protein L37E
MKCLHCGARAPAHATICAQCGHKLVRPGLMWRRCQHCGNLVYISRRVCAACGYPVARRRLRTWAMVALAPLVLVLLALSVRNVYAQLETGYLAAWPTALYELSLADMATATLAPLAPATTPTGPAPTMTPSATARPLRYSAPVLLGPTDGIEFVGENATIWLRWKPVGVLAADEFYVVSLRYQSNDAVVYTGAWQQDTEWLVPHDVWQRYDAGHPEYHWDVTVMRQTGTREDGSRTGEPVSATSAERVFVWE